MDNTEIMQADDCGVEPYNQDLIGREKIESLQRIIESMPQEMPALEHFFAHNIYARKGVIKKGTVLIGAIKKYSHINIMVSGDISIYAEGCERRLTGHNIMASHGGTKRVGYAHEDTVWITIISTSCTNVHSAEEEVLCKTYDEYEQYCRDLKMIGG